MARGDSAMATAVTVRADFSTDELRRLAAASKHAPRRRLLSLARCWI